MVFSLTEARSAISRLLSPSAISARISNSRGVSPSGVAMEPRSSSGSTARTVHYFNKISGTRFWPGGVAYGGDLSVYGEKS